MSYKCSFTPGEVQQENEINHSLIFSKGVICHKLAVRSRRVVPERILADRTLTQKTLIYC